MPPQEGLANNIHELRNASRHGANVGDFIRTPDDLWKWANNKAVFTKHPLGRLSPEALERFVARVEFRDYVQDGERYQHVGGFYYGDLLHEHGLGYRGVFAVFAAFGMNAEYAAANSGYRRCGDIMQCICCAYAFYTCTC